MRRLGLTGGIGSGKSTVARAFAALGAAVVDADVLAREAVAPGAPGLARVLERFGAQLLQADGGLDRRALGAIIFEDEEARRDLEAIVHPAVAQLAVERFEAAEAAGAQLALYDVPLLYESGLQAGFEAVVVVWASLATRMTRLRARDPLSDDELEARIAAQMPLEEKVERATHVIDNDGPLEDTEAAVRALYEALVSE